MEDKQLVNDYETEKIVLGTILSFPNTLCEIQEFITDDCFYSAKNRTIWNAIKHVSDNGEQPNLMTLLAYFSKHPHLNIKPADYAELGYTGIGVEQMAIRLQELAQRRKLWKIGMELVQVGVTESGDDIDRIRERTKSEVDKVFESATSEIIDLREAYGQLADRIFMQRNAPEEVLSGTPTGYNIIDKDGGLQKGDFIILAAASGQGKTSFAMNIITNAIEQGTQIGMFSLEMQGYKLAARIAAIKTGVNAKALLSNARTLTAGELNRVNDAMNASALENLHIGEQTAMSIENILVGIRTMKAKYNVEGVVIDYLQRIENKSKSRSTAAEQLSDMTRRLKNIALELDIWVIALSQLSGITKADPRPDIYKLYGSKNMSADADIIIEFYRPEYYEASLPEPYQGTPAKNMAFFEVVKGRNVGNSQCLMRFMPELTKFEDIPKPQKEQKTFVAGNNDDKMPF